MEDNIMSSIISKYISLDDIFNLANTNPSISQMVLSNESKHLFCEYNDYPKSLSWSELKKYHNLSIFDKMLKVIQIGDIKVMSTLLPQQRPYYEKIIIEEAINYNQIGALKWLLMNMEIDDNDLLQLMYNVCRRGNIEIIELFILYIDNDKHLDAMNYALQYTYLHGDRVIIHLLNNYHYNYNHVLVTAAEGGDIKIVELMLTYGADDYSESMIKACSNTTFPFIIRNRIKIIKIMLKLHQPSQETINTCAKTAINNNIIKILDMMLILGANNYKELIYNSINKFNTHMIKLILRYNKSYESVATMRCLRYGIKIIKGRLHKNLKVEDLIYLSREALGTYKYIQDNHKYYRNEDYNLKQIIRMLTKQISNC